VTSRIPPVLDPVPPRIPTGSPPIITPKIEEFLTPKEGPAREALLAEKRQEFRAIAPLRLMDRSAADGRCQALVPGDVVPEAGKLGMGEVGGAVETVAVLGA
jgi:hypothetical protein